jgi:hypothetical protein
MIVIAKSDVTARPNAAESTPETKAKEVRVNKKQKTDLSPEEVAEKRRRSLYRWKIILGLWSPFALIALDTTVIASAFSYIATDFST